MEWEGCRYFLALYRRKSLKAAARDLAVNQTTVGRRIEVLERELKVKLFEKRSNGFFPTVAGERMFEVAEPIEAQLLAIERQLSGRDQRLYGVLRLAMPGAIANYFLIPRLAPFTEQHPHIELQFLTGPEVLNLSRREADIAIRLVRPKQSDLVVRKIGMLELAFYCAKEKSKVWSMDSKKDNTASTPFVDLYERAMSSAQKNLMASYQGDLQTVVRSAAWSSVFAAVKAGVGVGILPTFLGESDASLERWNNAHTRVPIWLVMHPDLAKSARVRAFIEFLTQMMDEF